MISGGYKNQHVHHCAATYSQDRQISLVQASTAESLINVLLK
jgi:hypothetical protein